MSVILIREINIHASSLQV